MKKIKTVVLLILGLALVGCSNDSSSIEEQNEKLDQILDQVTKNNEKTGLPGVFTFKDYVDMEVIVLNKIDGGELRPNLLMVTDKNTEHNTPLIISVDDKELYDSINVDSVYNMQVYVTSVIEKEASHTRFEFTLAKLL